MRASTASAYVDEPSVRAFLRKVGTEYPAPVAGKGRSRKWDRDHLDKYPTTRPRPGPVPRRRLVMGWPRYMVEKRLAGGAVAHYWRPLASDLKGGFTLHAEKLGQEFATAKARADELNQHLDDWRTGKDRPRDLNLQPGFGTLEWLIERYKRSGVGKGVRSLAPRLSASVRSAGSCAA